MKIQLGFGCIPKYKQNPAGRAIKSEFGIKQVDNDVEQFYSTNTSTDINQLINQLSN